MKKYYIIALLALVFTGCMDLDFYRSDKMTSSMLKSDPSSAVYTTDGIYSMLKDVLEYRDSRNGNNTYIRHLFQMGEFRSDDMLISAQTSDALYESYMYMDKATTLNNGYFWYLSYKMIYAANANIAGIQEGASAASDHLLGENYFFRAFLHFELCNMFAWPYSHGKDKPGVVIRTSTDCSHTERATLEKCYDQIVKDLKKAAELMGSTPRHNHRGYVCRETALGLLSRVYLYMEDWVECEKVCDQLLKKDEGVDPASFLEADLAGYFKKTYDSKETLWCVYNNTNDMLENSDNGSQATIGSMYYSPNGTGGIGWCEIYASDPLLDLFERFPADKRYTDLIELYSSKPGLMVYWPLDENKDFRQNALIETGAVLNGDNTIDFDYVYQRKDPYTKKGETVLMPMYYKVTVDANGKVHSTQGTAQEAIDSAATFSYKWPASAKPVEKSNPFPVKVTEHYKATPRMENGVQNYYFTYGGVETRLYVRNQTLKPTYSYAAADSVIYDFVNASVMQAEFSKVPTEGVDETSPEYIKIKEWKEEKDNSGNLVKKNTGNILYYRKLENYPGQRFTYPMYMVKKFANQDGQPTLSSPAIIRYAEIILNRAEARARQNNDAGALADVDVIRTRAGIAPMTGNYATYGYAATAAGDGLNLSAVTMVVLDERRLELCFESQRQYDLFRNKLPINRQYGGMHTYEIIPWNDPRIPYEIPREETSVTGIPSNR